MKRKPQDRVRLASDLRLEGRITEIDLADEELPYLVVWDSGEAEWRPAADLADPDSKATVA